MAKISMKMTDAEMQKSKAKKSKVKKTEGDAVTIGKEYNRFIDNIKDILFEYQLHESSYISDMDEAVAELQDAVRIDYDVWKSKKMSTSDMVKALEAQGFKVTKARNPDILLRKGWKVAKAEEEAEEEESEETEETESEEKDEESTEEESEETEETSEESDETITEKARKMAKKDPYKAMRMLMKSKGWILKSDDEGKDSEELEDEVLDEDKDVEVPDTPEPSDDVEDTETGIPEEVPEAESEDNEEVTAEDGNDMDTLLPKTVQNIDIDLKDADEDLDEMIDKKRAQKGEDISLGAIGGMQPFKNNYRTVQRGNGKLDTMSQLKVNIKG